MTRPLSVIILTFNEEANLAAALDSVKGWAAEVFVVDSYSTDRTVDIALERAADGVHVVQHRFENYSDQWNWALTRLPIRQPWVLKLDADERATEAFRREVDARLFDVEPEEDAFIVHWRLIFMGRWVKWGGLYPNGNIRLWRRGKGRFGRRDVNEHLLVDGKVGVISSPIDHHDYKSLGHWIDRHNRYSAMEARSLIAGNMIGETVPRLFGRPEQQRMWLRRLYYRLPARPLLYFLYRYFLRLGLLDGLAGFRFNFLHACYFYWIDLKRAEYQISGELPAVIWPPRGLPHPVVAASELQRQVDTQFPAPAVLQADNSPGPTGADEGQRANSGKASLHRAHHS
jgi:glycosyltransferase involved in cell wall biosynthesis